MRGDPESLIMLFWKQRAKPTFRLTDSVSHQQKEAVAIADNVGAARTHSATFYGWAFLTAEEAGRNGRGAIASPFNNNPYHADIRLPELTAEDREEQKRHAQELADASRWRERPNLPEE